MTRDYTTICFVVMPFGAKSVLRWKVPFLPIYFTRRIDFDRIYNEVFRPAIEGVFLPEGGKLVARRADEDFFSGIIPDELCDYLEYSRIVLADITGLNANVIWELGVRHRARSSGTVVFRQLDTSLPFDIAQIRAFPYAYRPRSEVRKSRHVVSNVLEGSLNELRADSPVRVALAQQQRESERNPQFEEMLRRAERSLHEVRPDEAISILETIAQNRTPGALVHVRLAVLYRDKGLWQKVESHARAAIQIDGRYSEAHRELGIALNKLNRREGSTPGEAELRYAISLDPQDFDAHSSLGGALRRDGRLEEAAACYRRAAELSGGHPYPVLNELKTAAAMGMRCAPDDRQMELLARGALLRETQVKNVPASDTPWSYFDLGEIRFHQGRSQRLTGLTAKGIDCVTAKWQLTTHRTGLQMLANASEMRVEDREHLEETIRLLERAEQNTI